MKNGRDEMEKNKDKRWRGKKRMKYNYYISGEETWDKDRKEMNNGEQKVKIINRKRRERSYEKVNG